MSPPSRSIEQWIVRSRFETREEVEDYVRRHGGASATMDATIDLVFPRESTGMIEPPVPQATGKTPLEQLQSEGTIPQEEPLQPITPLEEPIPEQLREATQAPIEREVKKSLVRRFLDWLGS